MTLDVHGEKNCCQEISCTSEYFRNDPYISTFIDLKNLWAPLVIRTKAAMSQER